ncbi:MAG TPA: signal peptidase II [Acholeplasmataceae bacterium]|nr:signal peptidase II [Acholeplasmataceae bacterium]
MLIGFGLIMGLIIIDQLTKYIAVLTLTEGFSNIIIPNLLRFQLVYNDGASFGIFSGNQLFFSVVTVGALLIFGYFFTEIDFKNKKVLSIASVLLIAGTLGNAIDRLFIEKGVIDFINIPIIPLFATFNFADMYLNFGIVLFIIDLLFLERKRTDEENSISN